MAWKSYQSVYGETHYTETLSRGFHKVYYAYGRVRVRNSQTRQFATPKLDWISNYTSSDSTAALERIPFLIDNQVRLAEKAAIDIPVLKEVVNSQWRKEDELRKLKSDLAALDRRIQATIGESSAFATAQSKNIEQQTQQVFIEKSMSEMTGRRNSLAI